MGNNKNPNQKQPGEKEYGTFHYNPGNMSGKTSVSARRSNKTPEISKDESEKRANADGKKTKNAES